MVRPRRKSARAVALTLAVTAAATAVFVAALLGSRRIAEVREHDSDAGPRSGSAVRQPMLGATLFAPSAVLNADVSGSIPESSTESEWYVKHIAFLGDGDDIVYTVNKAYPNPPALFRLAFDPAAQGYAATGMVLAGLDGGQRAYIDIAANPNSDGVVAHVQSWDMADLNRSVTAPRDLFHLSTDGTTMTNLTEGCCMIDGYALTPDGRSVIGLDAGGDLLRIDIATRASTTIASGLKTPVGDGGGAFDVSPDGSRIALAAMSDLDSSLVQIIDSTTGTPIAQVPLPGEAMPDVGFDAAGARLYVLRAKAGHQTAAGAATYQTDLAVYDLAGRTLTHVADLTRATGQTALPGELVIAANRVFVVQGGTLYEIDTATGTAHRISAAGVTVLGNVIARPVSGGLRVAYVKSEPVVVNGVTQHVKQLIETTVLPW